MTIHLMKIKNNNYRSLCLLLSIIVVGCKSSTTFSPEVLPNATIGESYLVNIIIGGGPGPVIEKTFGYKISPENSGFDMSPTTKDNISYNNLTLSGTPKKTGVITIEIGGATYGTSIAGHSFKKKFVVKVNRNNKKNLPFKK